MRKSSKVFVGMDVHKESIEITLAEAAVRAVQEQDVLGRQQSPSAFKQRQRRGPRSNVNHVDAHDRVRRLQRPRKSGHVEINRPIDVCQLLLLDAQRNGLAKLRIWI